MLGMPARRALDRYEKKPIQNLKFADKLKVISPIPFAIRMSRSGGPGRLPDKRRTAVSGDLQS
jgi:hypothetical protein